MDTPLDVPEPELMTPAEVALKLRVKPWFVTKRCRDGELRATRPGKSWLIAQADLDDYLERHRNTPAEGVA